MTPEELVTAAMRRLGIDPSHNGANRRLAEALELNPGDLSQGTQTVRRWRQRGNGPSFDYTVRLLETAGLLRPDVSGDRPLTEEEIGLRGELEVEVERWRLLNAQLEVEIARLRQEGELRAGSKER